ncbi:MAG TPA: PCYCGC motif-containing (lipo)protein [Anaerolineales bacterium]|nr:PCYCGC motif-containing (lipo)protein [Anaerolineales bacterium]
MYKSFLLFVVLSIFVVTGSACSTSKETDLHMTLLDQMPTEVQMAPVVVQQAYQFASANPDVMKNIPCYCGCGNVGHTSNYSCYISHVDAKGSITFDHHALGCSICVDITQDVMRLLREGKTPQEARAYIDATYSKYGPSNIPEQ